MKKTLSMAFIHGFLWWSASSRLIFSLKWHLQSSFFLLHSTAIDLQEAKDSIDKEDPRPTSSTWSYITWSMRTLDTMKLVITMETIIGSSWLMGLMPLKSLSMNVMEESLLGDCMSTQLMSMAQMVWR